MGGEVYAQSVTANSAEPSVPWQQPDLFGLPAPPAASAPPQTPLAPAVPKDVAPAAERVRPAASSPSLPPIQAASHTQPQSAEPGSVGPASLLILDTETTALSPAEGHCIEVGAILFRVAERAVLAQVSFLMPATSNPAAHVNGIDAAITQLPQPWQAGLQCFEAMLAAADAVLAHNAAFDRQWFGHGPLPAISQPWICSMEDIRWPAERHLRASPSVRDLALAYGVPVWAAHRALTDCIYLAQVLERCADLEQLLVAALEPRRLFRACLSYSERQQAKQAGFRWNEPVRGAWSRRLSEREAAALPFAVQPLEAA
ncbi:MAG: 3'-5' exonuclease [Cyanobium sp. M30B3]|nr:MAG: 3'-5' exonuclease [Cyanobium sp. M30B3]